MTNLSRYHFVQTIISDIPRCTKNSSCYFVTFTNLGDRLAHTSSIDMFLPWPEGGRIRTRDLHVQIPRIRPLCHRRDAWITVISVHPLEWSLFIVGMKNAFSLPARNANCDNSGKKTSKNVPFWPQSAFVESPREGWWKFGDTKRNQARVVNRPG